ncbi:MAG: DUF6092 family protein [Candidatus Bipolaricaulota bacterium]|nr:DUF6092 family protein [Candidatus Bipolaricaulota bacterium]
MSADREQELFDLVGYMVTSARNLLDEPPLYGPFRLLDSASRLIAILEETSAASPRLLALRGRIEAGKYSVMGEETAFRAFLDDLVNALVDVMIGKQEGK